MSRTFAAGTGVICLLALIALLAFNPPASLGQSGQQGPFAHADLAGKTQAAPSQGGSSSQMASFDTQIQANATQMLEAGRQTFRFDTFGDETFWGDQLHLHQAIAGAALGGVGPGVR
jgi:hypothetical protein